MDKRVFGGDRDENDYWQSLSRYSLGAGMKRVFLAEDVCLANRQCALAEMIDGFRRLQRPADGYDRESFRPSSD